MARYESERYVDHLAEAESTRRGSMTMTPEQAALLSRSAATYPEVPAGTHIAASTMPNGQQIMETANVAAQTAAPPKKKKKKSLWQKATGVAGDAVGHSARGIGMAADWATPDPVEDVLGAAGNVAKPVARGGFAVLEAPLQTVVGAGRQTYGLATGQQEWEGWNDFGNDIAAQTTLGQIFSHWDLPGTDNGDAGSHIDLGTGFFPGQESQIVKDRVAKEAATARVGGATWTPGRWLASSGFGLDQSSTAYNIVSGAGDLTVAWFGDPANAGLKAVSQAGRGAKMGTKIVGEAKVLKAAEAADPAWRAMMDEAMGLVPGSYDQPRKSVLASNAARWLYSNDGRKVVTRLKDTKSTTEIMEASNFKFPLSLANTIAKSDDEVEIANALVSAMTSSVREIPTLGKVQGPVSLGRKVIKNRQAHGRLFNMMPDTRIHWEDPDEAFRNVRNAAANVGIHGEERAKLLDEWADALTAPLERRQARYNAINLWGKTLNTQLKANGVPDAVADAATQWTKIMDRVNTYDTDDMARGLGWADDSGTGPILVSQLLETGMYLYDPKSVRQLREFTASNKAMRFIAQRKTWRGAHALAAGFQTELWKPMQLIGPKYLAKVIPEETGRVFLGGAIKGPLGWMRTIFGDQYSLDATGGDFATFAQRADDLATEKESLTGALRYATDPADKKLVNQRLNEIEQELMDLNEEIASKATDVYSQAMNRKYSKKTGVDYGSNQLYEEGRAERGGSSLYDDMLKQQVRRGNMQVVHATQDLERWAVGQGESILGLHADPVARRVANGGLFAGDDELGAFRPGLDGIVDWLNLGGGRKFRDAFEEYLVSKDPVGGTKHVSRRMVDAAADDVLYRTGNDQELLQAIVTGKIAGDKIIGRTGAVTGNVPSSELKDALKGVFQSGNADISKLAKYIGTEIVPGSVKARDLERYTQIKDDMTRWFFQSVYGKYSDKLNRSPAFRGFYWRRVEELIPHMDQTTARAMLDEARGTIPKRQYEAMERRAAAANGDLDREAVDQLAGHAALEDTTDLLFDTTNRTQLFDVVRVMMPFGEAWREIITSYGRLIRQNPRSIRRFQQAINGMRGAGIMYKNEYGEESIALRGSGPLMEMATLGAVKADLSVGAKSLSIGTSVIPGMGAVVSMPVYKLIPDEPGTDWMREVLFPYGKPTGVDAVPLPGWSKRILESTGWVGGDVALNTQQAVMDQLYTKDPDRYAGDMELLIADAKAVSQGVLMMRGIAQAFSPGAPTVRYIAETEEGDVAAAKLAEEFRTMQLPESEGGRNMDYNDAVEEFLDRHGSGAALYIVGKTEAQVKGLDATRDFSNFERENGWLFSDHTEIAGYFGPHGAGFDYGTYVRQLEAGYRRKLTTNERIAAANQVIGSMMVRNQEEILEAQTPREEWGPAQRTYLKLYKMELEKELAGYTRHAAYDVNEQKRQTDDLFEAAHDERLADNKTAAAIREYQVQRQKMLDDAASKGYAGIAESNATSVHRTYLTLYGEALAREEPGFQVVWDRLLSREVEPKEPAGG